MHEKLLTIKEVAERLGLSEDAVGRFVADGKIPAYKVGGMLLRFKKEQIEQYRKRSASVGVGEAPVLSGGAKNRPAGFYDARGAGRRVFRRQEEAVPYSFLEKLEDFLYYNDFYILSCILLVLVIFAIFE